MPQFLIEPSNIQGDKATITGADAKHITTVLRLGIGDWLMLTDGLGHRFKATITEATPKKVEAKLSPSMDGKQRPTSVSLAQAIIKHDRFEWIIQKTVELGCSEIIPFTSERTIPKFHSGKMERWQKIADEAAKQCGTSLRPKIRPAVSFSGLVDLSRSFDQKILFYEGESSNDLNTYGLKSLGTIMIIGPEGGFSPKEVELASSSGSYICGLGPLILRVETAAIAGMALIQDKLGYFNG